MKNLILPRETTFMIFLISSFCLFFTIHLLALISGEFVKVMSGADSMYILRPAMILSFCAYLTLVSTGLHKKDTRFNQYQIFNVPFLVSVFILRADTFEGISGISFSVLIIVTSACHAFLSIKIKLQGK